uniref:Serine/threonine-protein phosphatase 4 regulatory subunit 2 n=1 Tax=Acrobeloides nanus TaxID=290746 RepID=A0A914C3A2_9BILA
MITRPPKPDKEFHPLAQYKEALLEFVPPLPEEEHRKNLGLTQYKDPLVDEFFEYVANKGKPFFTWEIIRPFFLWKLQTVMNDMHLIEAEELTDDLQKEALISNEKITESKNFIMSKAKEFDGIPFTIQRLCELLITPRKHYKSTEKFLRALEKNINVVTTITENGERVTGVDTYEEDKEEHIPVERNFIVSVDELDDPLPGLAPLKSPIFNRIINESPVTVTPEKAIQEVLSAVEHIEEATIHGAKNGKTGEHSEAEADEMFGNEGIPTIQAPTPPPDDPSADEEPRAPPSTPDLERPISQVRIEDDRPTLPSDITSHVRKLDQAEVGADFEPLPSKIPRIDTETNKEGNNSQQMESD